VEKESHAFLAGLFVIVLGAFGIAAVLWLTPSKGPAFVPIDLVTTHNVAGLAVGAAVRFRGVTIGTVDSIAFDAERAGRIRIRASVDPRSPITTATFARLTYQGINGVALIQLDEEPGRTAQPLHLTAERAPQMELQAGLLEEAEGDVKDVLAKAGKVADRLQALLDEENIGKAMALIESLQHTSARYGELARNLDQSARSLPAVLQTATQTLDRAKGAVDGVAKLALDVDQKLVVFDTVATTARRLGQVAEDLHQDTLPRVTALVDEVSGDARELRYTLREVNLQPQSFLFGLQSPPAGPGEHGFTATQGTRP
jgi:phospholipid/cholesterol/gamma-HCH transport system substrate-binding protein